MSNFPCKIIEADLDSNIVTLQMEGAYTVSVGQKYLCDDALVSAEPVAEVTGMDEYGPLLGWHKHWANFRTGTKFYTAPGTAQPDITQQTLDDVKAGIPARDAEIEALRKELETLQAQHAATLSSIEAFVACDASAISYLSLGEYRTALLKMLRQAKPQTMETQ